jgi:hypothetical protein
MFKCQECGKKYRKPVNVCSKCHGVDIDLDPNPSVSKKISRKGTVCGLSYYPGVCRHVGCSCQQKDHERQKMNADVRAKLAAKASGEVNYLEYDEIVEADRELDLKTSQPLAGCLENRVTQRSYQFTHPSDGHMLVRCSGPVKCWGNRMEKVMSVEDARALWTLLRMRKGFDLPF